jgi:hypothetical protein
MATSTTASSQSQRARRDLDAAFLTISRNLEHLQPSLADSMIAVLQQGRSRIAGNSSSSTTESPNPAPQQHGGANRPLTPSERGRLGAAAVNRNRKPQARAQGKSRPQSRPQAKSRTAGGSAAA